MQQQHVAGSLIPSAEEGRQYTVDYKLLAKVEHTQVVYTRFLDYGPKYLMVRGRDAEGRDRIVWLAGNASSGGIRVISETFSDDFLLEARIRELINDQAEIEKLYLAPNDRVEGAEKNKPIWFVEFKDKHALYLDPVSGQKLP